MPKTTWLQGEYTPQNPHKYSGKYPIKYKSSWELRMMKFFDLNESVLQWTYETMTVNYYDPIQRKVRRYFPDFTVVYFNKERKIIKEIIEIKPVAQSPLHSAPPIRGKKTLERHMKEMAVYITNMKKWEAVTTAANKMGYKFRTITETEIFGAK